MTGGRYLRATSAVAAASAEVGQFSRAEALAKIALFWSLSTSKRAVVVHWEVSAKDAQKPTPTQWVALSRDAGVIDRLRSRSSIWSPLNPPRRVRWTDDYSSVLSVLR